ncbi:MAG: exonuclease SbcCD subunit D [Promethearchaeota archaeon]
MPVRIAHISDTHLGARPRKGVKYNVWGEELRSDLLEKDFYDRFDEIFDLIAHIDPPVDLVIHSGDLYDSPWENNPQQPPKVAEETAWEVIKGFMDRTEIPVLIIEGNHGLYRNKDVSLLDLLRMSIPGLLVATQRNLRRAFSNEEPLKFEFDDFDVFCFPFLDYPVLESSGQVASFNDWISTYQKPNPKRPSIAVAHGMDLDRSLHGPIFSMDYDYVALGHDHHQRKQSGKAWYAGAPERWRFDESRHKKGFLLVEVSAGKKPKVTPQHIDFDRPMYNEEIQIAPDDTVESVLSKTESWLNDKGLKTAWDPSTAARIRLSYEGQSTKVGGLELSVALEGLRVSILERDSEYNIVQFVWSQRQIEMSRDPSAYPEIESEYLIEDPETDFKEYLASLELDETYDSEILTRVAVEALKLAASGSDEKLTLDTLGEGDS